MTPEKFYGWGQELMDSIPRYWEEDDFMQQYLMALGFEFEALHRLTAFLTDAEIQRAIANNLPDELESIMAAWFVRSANDYSLGLWESMLSIPFDNTLSRDNRIAGIITRMQTTQTPTPAYLKAQLLQYVEEVEILEHFDLPGNDRRRYSFDVHILHPTGFEQNIKDNIDAMVRRIKPSHLGYLIIYSEVTWHNDSRNMGNRTWAQLGNVTWSQLRFGP